jgi:hypothetical protein
MFALHLTQYACGISIQLSGHWNVVVFETHVELGHTHEGQGKKKPDFGFFCQEEAGGVLIQVVNPFLRGEHVLHCETAEKISLHECGKN